MNAAQLREYRALRNGLHLLKSPRGLVALALLAVSGSAGCHRAASDVIAKGETSMELTSSSFQDGKIPRQFTCDGADASPHLAWTAPPALTKSLALLVTDPDAPAGTWVHWVLFNLPATARELSIGVPKVQNVGDGSLQGRNDFGRIGYGGPCPPRGTDHRYFFRLYALDTQLNLSPGATRDQLESAMQAHILAQSELVARYGR
jgi:Raf kinase inhibitor-like YbhB/YbcL family protein